MNPLRLGKAWPAIIVVIVVGLAVFAYKVSALGFPLTPNQTTDFWDIEAKVSFAGTGGPAEVRIARVQDTQHLAVLDETYLSPSGFGVRRTKSGAERFATFERRELGSKATVFYRAVVVQLESSETREADVPTAVSEYKKSARRAAVREEQTPFLLALDELIRQAEESSANRDGFITQLIQRLVQKDDDLVQSLRAGGPRGVNEPARRMALVLNAADVPARRVEGLELGDTERDLPVRKWVEVWWDNAWRPIDSATGETLDAKRLIPLSTRDLSLVRYSGLDDVYVSFAVQRRPRDAVAEALRRGDETAPIISAISLMNLPIHAQDIFKVILLVPVGGLIIAFMRQVIGLPSFGTFMPVLIALSFRETSLLTGLILFVIIVGVGLMLRSYFKQLQLLVVPRLASVLTIVTLLMAVIALVANAFNMPLGLSISLFPLIIITMTIERMSLTWDEYGAREAMKRAGGALLAAVIAYFVISNPLVEHYVFTFPELLLVVLGLTIVLGRYNGYKLTEYWRFRKLTESGMA